MANDQTVLAASQLINVNAGEAVSTLVKLPFRIPPFAGMLGDFDAGGRCRHHRDSRGIGRPGHEIVRRAGHTGPISRSMADLTRSRRALIRHAGVARPRLARRRSRPEGDVHLLDRFAILYRYRRIAITVFILTTAC